MHHHFQAEQWLPYPVEQVFDFFAIPANLPPLMPAWQQARIEQANIVPPPPRPSPAGPTSGVAAGAGTTMTLTFRPFPLSPVRIPWDAEITEFAWNDHFCDIQHRGPFAFWRHCHTLLPQLGSGSAQPGTLLTDKVEYALPLGALGEIARTLFIERQFRSMFAFRHRRTADLLAAATH